MKESSNLTTAISWLCLPYLLLSCSPNHSTDLASSSPNSSSSNNNINTETETDSATGIDNTVDEPVMIGGAFLACAIPQNMPPVYDSGDAQHQNPSVNVSCSLTNSANQAVVAQNNTRATVALQTSTGAVASQTVKILAASPCQWTGVFRVLDVANDSITANIGILSNQSTPYSYAARQPPGLQTWVVTFANQLPTTVTTAIVGSSAAIPAAN